MQFYKSGERSHRPGNPAYFTGNVSQEPVIEAPEPARVRAVIVSFEAGARTYWHTHPLGQTLYVMAGEGRFQMEGEPVREIRPGDTIWIAPGEKHWHGAAPHSDMQHLAIQEALGGEHITWLEPVSQQQYLSIDIV